MNDEWTEDAWKIVERYLLENHCQDRSLNGIPPGESLFGLEILDSLALAQTICFLEGAFQVAVDDADIVPENFESIAAIVALGSRVKRASLALEDKEEGPG
jgi:acyl carrier protein